MPQDHQIKMARKAEDKMAKDLNTQQPVSVLTPELMTGVADVLKGVLPSLVGRRKAKGRVFKEQKPKPDQGFVLPVQAPQLPVKQEKPKTNYLKYLFWGVALIGTGYGSYWLYSKYKNRKEIPVKQNPEVNPLKSFVNSTIDRLEDNAKNKDDKEKDTVINLNINNLNGEKQSVGSEKQNSTDRQSQIKEDDYKVNRPKENESKEERKSRFSKFVDEVDDDEDDGYEIENPHSLDFEEEDG